MKAFLALFLVFAAAPAFADNAKVLCTFYNVTPQYYVGDCKNVIEYNADESTDVETCQKAEACLNNLFCANTTLCLATTIRGGWVLKSVDPVAE